MDKKNRFNAAIDYLMEIGKIKKQKDVAKAIGCTETTISQARKGVERSLTDNLLFRFLIAYPNIFNLHWLIDGNGEMLLNSARTASTKQQRLNAAYDYLKFKGIVKKQTDVAEALESTQQNVSAALNGNEKALTDAFLMRFLAAYPDTFSTRWLMTGNGSMLINAQNTFPESLQTLTAQLLTLAATIHARVNNIDNFLYETPDVSPRTENQKQ